MGRRQTELLLCCLLLMPAGLLFSRALLSVALIGFVTVSLAHRHIGEQCRRFLSSPYCWGLSLLFLLPALSGWWSEDRSQWLASLQVKLSLLFLPLAFSAPFTFSRRQWDLLAFVFLLLVLVGVGWSIGNYLSDAKNVALGYLRAKSLITPLHNDHVRFSWLVAMAVIPALMLYREYRSRSAVISFLSLAAAVLFVLYLHLLAARTGLLAFYLCILVLAAFWIRSAHTRMRGFLLLIACVVLPVVATLALPSLQNRLQYLRYESAWFRKGAYLPGATDAVRVLSWKAGWSVMMEQPLTGTGFGDILQDTRVWYASHVPGMLESDKIYPSSEWLFYGAALGLPGFLLFTLAVAFPLLQRTRYPLPWVLLQLTAAASFIADIGLEVQYGVFLYAFLSGWWARWFEAEPVK